MPLPKLDKSWQFDLNQVYVLQDGLQALLRSLIRGIKDSLVVRLGSRVEITSPWSVTQSSDGVSVSEGDLWTSDSALTWGDDYTLGSWIVLQQPGVTTSSQICILLHSEDQLRVIWAPRGFDLGTLSERPKALVEMVLSSSWQSGVLTSNVILHAMQSTDGQCTRVIAYCAGAPIVAWLFDRARNPVANWQEPAAALASLWDGDDLLSYAALQSPSEPRLWGHGDAPMQLFMSTESFGQSAGAVGALLDGPNDFDQSWPLTPIGVASLTGGQRGRHGELFDLWFGSTGAQDGDTYPANETRQFVQFGHLVFPWDGTPQQAGSIPLIA